MVVYLDLAFFANLLADALGLFLTAKLTSLPAKWTRIFVASLVGAAYGALCLIPAISFLGRLYLQILVSFLLTYIAFGKVTVFFRIVVINYLVSCMLGGMIFSFSQTIAVIGVANTLQQINWKVYLLVSSFVFFLLSFVFRGSMKHAVFGEILRGKVTLDGSEVSMRVLLDTGHTLRDPYSGVPVLTMWYTAAEALFTVEEWAIMKELQIMGCSYCCEKLSVLAPGKFTLIPYRAVGLESAMMLCFRCDMLFLCGKKISPVMVALSPTSLSDDGGVVALWGEDLS